MLYILTAILLMIHFSPLLASDLSVYEQRQQEWAEKIAVIKARTEDLMATNDQLLAQREALLAQIQELSAQVTVEQQQAYQKRQLVNQRNGKTDQQVLLEQLVEQERQQQQQLKELDKEIKQLRQQVTASKKKMAPETDTLPMLKEVSVIPSEKEIKSLRDKLNQAKQQELDLESKANQLRQQQQNPEVTVTEIDALIDQLASLDDQLISQAQQLSPQGKEHQNLKIKIKVLEQQIENLKNPEDFSFEWEKQRKRLIKDMTKKDQYNQSLRQKIIDIKEDIELLRTQIGVLERRAYVPQRSR